LTCLGRGPNFISIPVVAVLRAMSTEEKRTMEPISDPRAVTEEAPLPRPVLTPYEKIVAEIITSTTRA